MEPPRRPPGRPCSAPPKKPRPGNLPAPDTTEASGSSESDPTITVLSARYRAAWPRLRPRPLELSKASLPGPLQFRQDEIEWTARKILRDCNIIEDIDDDAADVCLVQQQLAGQPKTSIPTITICAPLCEKGTWEAAVEAIAVQLYKIFKNSKDVSYENIYIDMQAPQLTQTIFYGPVDRDDLCHSWDNIRTLVHQRLDSFLVTSGCMTSICLFRYGLLREINANPVTVYVSLSYDSLETGWPEVMADIKANIDNRGWTDVEVHFEHNLGFDYAFRRIELQGHPDTIRSDGIDANKRLRGDYQQRVKPGDDFGAATYITRSDNVEKSSGLSTLGCFVELRTATNPTWKRYALTNYHAIRPALAGFTLKPVGDTSKPGPPELNSDCWKVDFAGYYPNAPITPMPLESPSRAKHIFTIWSLDDDIARWEGIIQEKRTSIQRTNDRTVQAQAQADILKLQTDIQMAKKEKREKIDFFDANKHILGTLFAASGYARRASAGNHKMRLDWALIEVAEHRQGQNRLPPRSVWFDHHPSDASHPDSATYGQTLKDPAQSIGPGNKSRVWKVGATTGPTIGEFHKTKSSCTMAEDKHLKGKIPHYATSEYVYQPAIVAGTGKKFCAAGDSGSVVFDKQGAVVGLFLRGSRVTNSFDGGHGLVTPIEHVFRDIRDFSRGAITEIRIART
ncbi:hypothetical protein FSHL1_010508 [Fusarium sambucinum]